MQDEYANSGDWEVVKDYISNPRADGYRSIHLKHREANDSGPDLFFELQIRTHLQHIWSTAVETVSIFNGKNIRYGEHPEWGRLFSVVGTINAFTEGTPIVPETPVSKREAISELIKINDEMQVVSTIVGFTSGAFTVNYIQKQPKNSEELCYCLLALRRGGILEVGIYNAEDSKLAFEDYMGAEGDAESDDPVNVVLVSLDKIDDLSQAYPNYLRDLSQFSGEIMELLSL